MSTHSSNYIIIGAGAFGASTALHLSRKEPSASIVLIDRSPFPCPIAASTDINKIVRADYADLFYCRLGLKALDVWRNDPLFKPYYHQSGMLSVYTIKSQQVKRMLENFRTCGVNDEAEIITPADMKRRFGGVYADATFYGHEEILWNPNSGWAEADKALKHTIEAAVAGGVQYISASVSKLILEDGSCAGVETDGGDRYIATKTILCTGAGTAKLLADSAPKQMALQVNGRITAGGISSASVNLSAQQIEKYKDTPALLIETDKLEGEAMPPLPDGQMKFIGDIPFQNTVDHVESGQRFSVPFTTTELSQWTPPESTLKGIREEVADVIRDIFGRDAAEDLKPHTYRLCWDGLAPDENWFICPHTKCQNLFIATAGTWHGWKFLPIVGEFVVQMLYGELPEVMAARWAWDRDLEDIPANDALPQRELRDIEI